MNTLYDHEHYLTQEDVDAANALVRHIERTRNPLVPQVGDRVRYTTRHGDFHGNALIEAVREDGMRSICLCPYVPFVWATADGIGCSVSGGPFTAVMPQELKPSGAMPGDFCAWGHCGACGNGVVRFCAEVPLWEFREGDPLYGDFSTEKWRKISLYKDTENLHGNLYRGDCISFRTEEEFRRFLSDCEGTVFAAPNPKSVIVWGYRDEQVALPRTEWKALDVPVTERRIYNTLQPVKLVKDHGRHTAVCYFVLKPSGAVPGDFCAWGHCGACGNGVVRFCAEVPLWEYREPESLYGDFSTEKWRKISLYKDTECRNGDLYRGECISFGSEEEFQRFLSDYEGTVFAAPCPKSVIVWCYRDEQTAVSQEKWDALDAPVTERRIYNAPQPVKLVKDHGRHTTVCYFVRPEFSYK